MQSISDPSRKKTFVPSRAIHDRGNERERIMAVEEMVSAQGIETFKLLD